MNDVDKRIKRIIGQLQGIQKMVQTKRDCIEVLQQISAVKKAIDGLTTEVVTDRLENIVSEDQKKEVRNLIQRTISL